MDSLLPFVLGFLGGVIAAVIFVVAYKLGRGTRPQAQAMPRAEVGAEQDVSHVAPPPTLDETGQNLGLQFQGLEREAWESLRRLSLSAAGGGLAISFLVLRIDGARAPGTFPFAVLPLTWVFLLVALFLGLASYLWKVGGLREGVRRFASLDPGTELYVDPDLRWWNVAERAFVLLSVLAVAAAFTLLVIAGFSLNEAGPPPPSTPTLPEPAAILGAGGWR